MPISKGNADFQNNTRNQKKEVLRSQGRISCAECRRLKLRCDKKIPCSSCLRRGCSTICPNGVLSGGQGTRFVLADTEELHSKMNDMSERIRQLEDALKISHANHSEELHPLLSNELLKIKFGVDIRDSPQNKPEQYHDALEALGTLTIMDGGETRFLGPSGAAEGFLLVEDKAEYTNDIRPELPQSLSQISHMWPFMPMYLPVNDLRAQLEAQLPPLERASALSEAYLENLTWFVMVVDRQQIMEELLPTIYKKSATSSEMKKAPTDVHELALAFIVFACGAAADLTQKPNNAEGERYFQLARAALSLQPVLARASLASVQTIALMGAFGLFSYRQSNLEEAWKTISVALSISGSIGIHRDPSRWKLDAKFMERRRKVFWEIYFLDNWQCLAGGRPPTFVPRSVDVQLPVDSDVKFAEDGYPIPSYRRWKLRLLKECLASVVDRLCADAAPLKYYEVLQFDKTVRNFDDQRVQMRDPPAMSSIYVDPIILAQQLCIPLHKDILLLYFHRNFFAKAIIDYPENPLHSPFALSFLSTYRSATSILKTCRESLDHLIGILLRIWPIWAQLLACGVAIGSVAVRCPTFSLASSAEMELEHAIDLFKRAQDHPVVKGGLPVLLRLREKARQAKFMTPINSLDAIPTVETAKHVATEDDELAILRGASRLVSRKASPPISRPDMNLPTPQLTSENTDSPYSYASHAITELLTSDEYLRCTASDMAGVGMSTQSCGVDIHPDVFKWAEDLGSFAQQPQQWLTATSISAGADEQAFANLEPGAFSSSHTPLTFTNQDQQSAFAFPLRDMNDLYF